MTSNAKNGFRRMRVSLAWYRVAPVAACVLAVAMPLADAYAQQRPGTRPAAAPVAAPAAPAAAPAPTPASVGDPVIRTMLDLIQDYEQQPRREPVQEFIGRVASVVRDHPQFMSQDQNADAAKGAIDEAWAGYLPTISGSSDGGYRRFGPTFNGTPGYTRNGLGAGLQLRQTVFDFVSVSTPRSPGASWRKASSPPAPSPRMSTSCGCARCRPWPSATSPTGAASSG
jgi:hypothetical protein